MSVGYRGAHVHVHADKLQKKRLKYPVPTWYQMPHKNVGDVVVQVSAQDS